MSLPHGAMGWSVIAAFPKELFNTAFTAYHD